MMKMDCNSFTLTCTIFTRIVAIGYAVLAFFTFLEARDLAQSNGYQYEEATQVVYVPLLLCTPPSVQNDGSSFVISSDSNCRDMNYLISAPFVCSACSAIACMFFVIMDILARYERGPFDKTAVAGMGLYLVIILVQAGISTGALVEQNLYWVNYMQEYLDREGFDATAKPYASTQILVSSAGCAFITAFLILVDAIMYRCNEKRQAKLEAQRLKDFIAASKEDANSKQRTDDDDKDNDDIKPSKTIDTAVDAMDMQKEVVQNADGVPSWMLPV